MGSTDVQDWTTIVNNVMLLFTFKIQRNVQVQLTEWFLKCGKIPDTCSCILDWLTCLRNMNKKQLLRNLTNLEYFCVDFLCFFPNMNHQKKWSETELGETEDFIWGQLFALRVGSAHKITELVTNARHYLLCRIVRRIHCKLICVAAQ